MATDKRERQRANRALKQELEEKQEKQEQLKQRGYTGLLAVAAVLALATMVWFATRGDDTVDTEADGTASTAQAADGTDDTSADGTADSAADGTATTATTMAEVAVSAPTPGGAIDGPTECPPLDGSAERITSFTEAPPMCIDPAKTYTAVMATTKGDITIALDAAAAPTTVNNFVVLSAYHYYDDVPFHRIIPGFVIQGGDAVGPRLGVGNPGYAIDDELPAEGAYQVGSLAMANSGPNTSGSQFFIITGDQGVALPPDYSLFGQVTEGMDVVSAIEAIPTDAADAPTEPITITSVTITES